MYDYGPIINAAPATLFNRKPAHLEGMKESQKEDPPTEVQVNPMPGPLRTRVVAARQRPTYWGPATRHFRLRPSLLLLRPSGVYLGARRPRKGFGSPGP